MDKFFEKLTPTDIIAFILVIGCLILKGYGFDGTVSNILLTIVAVYFGKTQIYEPIIASKLPSKTIESVESMIRRIAIENGVDQELAVRVARCESGLKPNAVNINTTGSKDRGIFQWNDYYHPEITDKMAFDVKTATELFCKAIKEGHLDWWNASRKCWDQ